MQIVEVTEKAALNCFHLIGKGDGQEADRLAVEAMRGAFQQLPMDIQVVIGEGERDQAPRLYTGERLGDEQSRIKIDTAVDPLEGTSICAKGEPGALSVMALAPRGALFKAPDIYMRKIACGPKAEKIIDLQSSPRKNIQAVAEALEKRPEEIKVGVLNRPRHDDLIAEIRQTGASIHLVDDGDVTLALNTVFSSLDLLMGTGGSPEGVLSAVALRCLGGGFQGQLVFGNEEEKQRALKAGVKDLHKVWKRDELVREDSLFCATGVTSGPLLKGIEKSKTGFITHSLILTPRFKKELTNQHLSP